MVNRNPGALREIIFRPCRSRLGLIAFMTAAAAFLPSVLPMTDDRYGAIPMRDRQRSSTADVELSTLPHALERRSNVTVSDRHSSMDRVAAGTGRKSMTTYDDDTATESDSEYEEPVASLLQHDDAQQFLAEQADQGQNFTLRGVLVGLAIGIVICFSNTYFGLQTGWVSGMAMPAALIGFGFFKTVARCISYPFTPVENVLVQTVAGALGTMPLGCGFVGVMPALNYLLKTEENGPLILHTGKLIVWAVGICLFGVVFAVPLRKEVIIREKLKFPSGTATALMIGVLHGDRDHEGKKKSESGLEIFRRRSQDIRRETSMEVSATSNRTAGVRSRSNNYSDVQSTSEENSRDDWKAQIRLLIIAFGVSAVYVSPLYLCCVLTLIHSDPRYLLHSSPPWSSSVWSASSQEMVMDSKPLPCLRCKSHNPSALEPMGLASVTFAPHSLQMFIEQFRTA